MNLIQFKIVKRYWLIRAIKAINPNLDVDIYDETNNSVEAVIHNIMYDVIGYCAKNTR